MKEKSRSAWDRKTAAIVDEIYDVANKNTDSTTELVAYFLHMGRDRPKDFMRVLAWQAEKDPAFRADLKEALYEVILLNLPRPDRLDS